MTFLNMALLGGMIAGAVPIIIHLLNRSRFRVVKWGAMHLLENIIRTQKRRLRWEQWLLLLVRALIPIMLALCMARPVIVGVQGLMGQTKSSVTILLDNSYSMNATVATRSQFSLAQQEASAVLSGLPKGTEASVLWMAGGSRELVGPSFDIATLNRAVMGMERGNGVANPSVAMEKAVGVLSRAHYANRDVLIISDFQKTSWSDEAIRERKRAAELLANMPTPPRITLMQTGQEVTENVAVESLDLSRPILGVGQQVRVRASIKNYGKREYGAMRVYFRVDGIEKSASQIDLGPRQTNQVLFSHVFTESGSHVIELVADADTLKADNVLRVSVPVWDQLPVLLVNGDPGREILQGETDFLEIALQPFSEAGQGDLADVIAAEAVTLDRFRPSDLNEKRVVVLANVAALSEPQLTAVEDYTRQGGGLIIFPGDKTNAAWYNEKLGEGGRGLLPCMLGDLAGSLTDVENAVSVVASHYDHPALAFFNDPRKGSLDGPSIRVWYRLEAPDVVGANLSVMARLDTGDPFLVEKGYGRGRVILCSTSADIAWTDYPLKPIYLPLMQQMVTWLAARAEPSRNIEVGQQLVGILPPATAGKVATITDPAGQEHRVVPQFRDTHALVEFDQTSQPGVYMLQSPDEADSELIHFVVRTPRQESNLDLLTAGEVQAVADEIDAGLVESGQDFLDADERRRFGWELWKLLLLVTLGLVFFEMYLQQRISGDMA